MAKVNIVVDATMLDTFQACPAKYNYRFNLHKVTDTKPKPLDTGSLIHIGEETYFKFLKDQKPYLERIQLAREAMYEASIDSDLEPEEVSTAINATLSSMEHWREADERVTVIAIESPFAYILYEDDEIRIVMIGKIDLLVNEPGYDTIPWDHKSYSRDFPVKRLVNQFCNYVNATGATYLRVNRIGLQKSLKPHEKHKRVMLSYDSLILEEWRKNTVAVLKDYVTYAGENNWPMNLTSCDKYNRLCEYYEICDSSGPEAKQYKLMTNFKTGEKWDVSAVLGKKKE